MDITPGFNLGISRKARQVKAALGSFQGSGGGRANFSNPSGNLPRNRPVGYFWKGADGKVYVQGANGINAAGRWDANTANYYGSRGFIRTADSAGGGNNSNTSVNTGGVGDGGGGGSSAKTLDLAQLKSLDSLINSLGVIKGRAVRKARIRRDTSLREKNEEKEREEGKYKGKKLSTLQDFATAKTDTDLNTRNTLENLISSLSTLGLGGSRALTRQLIDAANISNRKANATQATNNRDLDTSWNEYESGYKGDVDKIHDQFGYDRGEARRAYLQKKQNALYKKADVYGAADQTSQRDSIMRQGNRLNSRIAGADFVNPRYTGKARQMATPELGDYTQDIARYDTTNIADANADPLTPVTSDGLNVPGNTAVRAIAVNDKDLGIKKKDENDLGYGV